MEPEESIAGLAQVTGGMLQEVDPDLVHEHDPTMCINSVDTDSISQIDDEGTDPGVAEALNLADNNGDYGQQMEPDSVDSKCEDHSDISGQNFVVDQECEAGNELIGTQHRTLCLAMVQGTPVLVLANNGSNGTLEANMMIDHTSLGQVIKVSDLHNIAQTNLILQTQEKIAQEYCMVLPTNSTSTASHGTTTTIPTIVRHHKQPGKHL